MPTIKRQVQLAGAGKVYYKVASSDYQAILQAIHTLEQERGLVRGALVKGFKDKQDPTLWDSAKTEVHPV
ncbi:MAG: hypothetical protein LLG40_13900 [Deltaproteobacteria bacterium]|nr:hypothetical protein [Deltaproteobacteria bacterium]